MAKAAPAKKPLTKSQLIANIAEETEVSKKQVAAVLESLANQIKTRFLATAAHDLKNPLGGILLMADMQELKANPDRPAVGTVLEAQLAALDAVRPGVTAGAVDRAARRVLRAAGMEKAFVHSTGHGLGLEIHEGPRLGHLAVLRLRTNCPHAPRRWHTDLP